MARWGDKKIAPAHDVYGNLNFSPYGVYAFWIITPPDKPLADSARLIAAAAAHRELSEILPVRPGFSMTSSLKDPRFIFQQQSQGVNLAQYPVFEQICIGREREAEATRSRFDVYWMWARLSPPAGWGNPMSAARHSLAHAGFWRIRPSRENLEYYHELMLKLEEQIPAAMQPFRPTSAQLRWYYRRQHTLGVVDKPIPLPEYSDGGDIGYRWKPQIDVFEGGDGRTLTDKFGPMLRVDSFDDGQTTSSYQIHLAVTNMPRGGIYFPGSKFTELITNLQDRDGDRIAVDWSERAGWLPLSKANRRNQSGYNKINEQFEQQDGRGSTRSVADSADELDAFEEELTENPREAEIEYVSMFSVGAPTPEKALLGYRRLREELEGLHVETEARVGQQKLMFRAMRPGREDKALFDSFAQYTTRTSWSRYIPLTSNRFGDNEGRAIGLSKMSSNLDFVFLNTRGQIRQNTSGGMIVGGDPRTGKTYFVMGNAAEEAVSGATVVAFDSSGQWRKFGQAVPGSQLFNLGAGTHTVDPLVTNPGREGAKLLIDALIAIAELSNNDPAVTELRLLVGENDGRRFSSAAALLDFLNAVPDENGVVARVPDALGGLGRTLLAWTDSPEGEALFGRKDPETGRRVPLPALALDEVSLLVVDLDSLDLPSEVAVKNAAAGGKKLSTEQVMSQRVMALFLLYLKKVFYGRKDHRDIIVIDEGWRLMVMEELVRFVEEVFRTGPAANLDLWLISQKPWREFKDLATDLARVRVMFAVRGDTMESDDKDNEDQSAEAAKFMGVNPARYPHIVDTIAHGLSPRTELRDPFHRSSTTDVLPREREGECLIRIGEDLGWMKSFEMVFPEWHVAADTKPAKV